LKLCGNGICCLLLLCEYDYLSAVTNITANCQAPDYNTSAILQVERLNLLNELKGLNPLPGSEQAFELLDRLERFERPRGS
jgi:hypothetical protein